MRRDYISPEDGWSGRAQLCIEQGSTVQVFVPQFGPIRKTTLVAEVAVVIMGVVTVAMAVAVADNCLWCFTADQPWLPPGARGGATSWRQSIILK